MQSDRRVCRGSMLRMGRLRGGLSRIVHSSIVIPNLYAGIVVGGEQAVCTDLRLTIGLARDHLEFRDTIDGI